MDNLEAKHERCPHCGGHPEMIHGMQDGWVACTKCVATGPRRSSDEDAWAAWDRRVAESIKLTDTLEAVERLRENLQRKAFATIIRCKPANVVNWDDVMSALAATEPATVELPKCDHCGAIACGTDCDGSSHYTPEKKE